jgi:hypothetical protein
MNEKYLGDASRFFYRGVGYVGAPTAAELFF